MSAEIIALAVGMIVVWLIFTWVIKVLKASVSTALAIAIIFLLLHIFLGIDYQQVWQELNRVFEKILTI